MSYTTARDLAFKAYKRIIDDKAYSNLVLNNILNKSALSIEDRALTTKIVYGTLQWQGLLDHYLQSLSKRPVNKLSSKALYLLRIGAYQILFLDRVPDRACVDETVKVAKKTTHKGIVSLVNGILRNLSRQKSQLSMSSLKPDSVEFLAVKYSHPQWMVKMWLDQFGYDKTISIMEANNDEPEQIIRVNTLITDKSTLQKNFADIGFTVEPVAKVPEALYLDSNVNVVDTDIYQQGHFQLQDLNSMVVAHLCSPKKNQIILDLCSAPGGKTTHLAQLMQNSGSIVAVDIHDHRVNLVKQVCERLGVTNVSFILKDGTELPDSNKGDQFREKFDICLVDAPCSGLGTLRKRPELKWTITESDLEQLTILQHELLRAASEMVKSGGSVIYSTCTINYRENQHQVERFLANHSNFTLTKANEIIEPEMLATAEITDGMVTFFPIKHQGDGFFMAKLTKS